MKDPLGVSPSKGNQGTTRGKEKKFFWPRWESNPRSSRFLSFRRRSAPEVSKKLGRSGEGRRTGVFLLILSESAQNSESHKRGGRARKIFASFTASWDFHPVNCFGFALSFSEDSPNVPRSYKNVSEHFRFYGRFPKPVSRDRLPIQRADVGYLK